ncbi:MAG TPA: hypothetical protein DC047_01495 [Blastocatellia bacterium]|nr:hypothetical protein [Blastocatellia bacterium]
MGEQSDADPHLLSQAAAIQGEGLTILFTRNGKPARECAYATQAAGKKQSAKHLLACKLKRKAEESALLTLVPDRIA